MADDFNGFERLRHTEGPWKWVAIVGLLVMLAGLATFGFAILSVITSMSTARSGIPQIPTLMPIGFGIGLVGAILYSLGLAFGVPKHSDFGRPTLAIHGPRFDSQGGPITIHGDVATVIYKQRMTYVNQLGRAINQMGPVPMHHAIEVEEAYAELQEAVEADAPPDEIAGPLERLARTLKNVGAVAGGATAAIEAIKGLAIAIGPVGQTVLAILGKSG